MGREAWYFVCFSGDSKRFSFYRVRDVVSVSVYSDCGCGRDGAGVLVCVLVWVVGGGWCGGGGSIVWECL